MSNKFIYGITDLNRKIPNKRICPMCKKEFCPYGLYQKYCTPTKWKTGCGAVAKKFNAALDRNGIRINIRPEDIYNILETQGYKCGICGDPIDVNKDFSIDHIIPISRKGKNIVENIQITHYRCNITKNILLMDELLELAEKMLNFHRKVTTDRCES